MALNMVADFVARMKVANTTLLWQMEVPNQFIWSRRNFRKRNGYIFRVAFKPVMTLIKKQVLTNQNTIVEQQGKGI
jgi:hypothetical protein